MNHRHLVSYASGMVQCSFNSPVVLVVCAYTDVLLRLRSDGAVDVLPFVAGDPTFYNVIVRGT